MSQILSATQKTRTVVAAAGWIAAALCTTALIAHKATANPTTPTSGLAATATSTKPPIQWDLLPGTYRMANQTCPNGVRLRWLLGDLNKQLQPGGLHQPVLTFTVDQRIIERTHSYRIQRTFDHDSAGNVIPIPKSTSTKRCWLGSEGEYKIEPSTLLDPNSLMVVETAKSDSCGDPSNPSNFNLEVVDITKKSLIVRYDQRRHLKGSDNLEGNPCNDGLSQFELIRIPEEIEN